MDGLHRALGCPVPLEVGGVVGLLRPMTLMTLGSVEALILLRRRNPTDLVADVLAKGGYTSDVARSLLAMAYDDVKRDRALRVAGVAAIQTFLGTLEGCAYVAWACFDHPRFDTFEAARGLFLTPDDPDLVRRFARARDLASGCDLLANLDWPERTGESGSGPVKFIPWRRIMRWFAEQYGWGPDKVGALTLYSLNVYACEESKLGGTRRLSLADYKEQYGHPGKRSPSKKGV